MKTELAPIIKYCKEHNVRFGREREIIADRLVESKGHLSADEIYDMLKGDGISRTTVYRTLALLKRTGLFDEHDFGTGKKYYEYTGRKEHHDHLYCMDCGAVIEFREDGIEKLQDAVLKKYNFKMVYHSHKLFGYCQNCKDKCCSDGTGNGQNGSCNKE